MGDKSYGSFRSKGIGGGLSIHYTDSRSQDTVSKTRWSVNCPRKHSKISQPSTVRRWRSSEALSSLPKKNFLKANYTDNVWWSRSDWKAHTEREHGVFWRQGPSTPIGNDNQSLNPNFQDSFDVGRSADICPLCCLPLDKSRPKLKSIAVLSVSSGSQNLDEVLVTSPPGSKKDFEGTKEGAKTVRFDVPKSGSEEEPPRDPTARSVADLETRIVAPMKTPVMDSTMSLMMDHIADHLQFLALLTLRLSVEKLADGDLHAFSSSQSFSSDEDSEKRSTLDDEMGTDEGYEVPEIDEDASFDTIVLEEKSPDLASSKNE
ncbi:hypothetical protein CI102_7515 [Trichoderma harzianum]|nr:hypothetical protein CI102_7515 [Trichoderma harzianum]